MSQKFKTIITNAGAQKLAAGLPPDGEKVVFAAMAVGDGGGTLPDPKPEQTALVHEVWRALINTITPHPKYANCIVVELVIPPEVGGFWTRELGLYDREGVLIAVANMAESYKPLLAEGSGRAQTVRMVIAVSNITSVELQVDSSTVIATKEYVDDALDKHAKSRNHPDGTLKEKGFVQLSSATDSDSETLASTLKAVKAAVAVGDAANQNAEKRLLKTSNLNDVQDKAAARKNMGLGTAGLYPAETFLAAGNSLSDVMDKVQARLNIGLGSASVHPDTDFLATGNNLSDVSNKATALENLGGVPKTRKINGHTLDGDKNVTAQDIFDGQAVYLGESADLNNYTTPGLYFQPANANAIAGKNYPEPNAGSLEIYKHAGVTQVYRIYNNSRTYVRSWYVGVWSAWVMQYNKDNRPTAAEVNAVSADGGSYNKPFAFGSIKTVPSESNTAELFSQTGTGGTVVSGVNVQWYDNKFTVGIVRGGSTDTDGFVIQHNGYTRLRIDRDGNLTSVGTVNAGGAQFSTVGDAYGTAWGGWLSTWLGNNTVTSAYVNQRIQDVQNWTAQNFISSMDLTAPVEVGFRDGTGYPRGTDGAAMYNFQMVGGSANVGVFVIRYHRFYRGGQWITLN